LVIILSFLIILFFLRFSRALPESAYHDEVGVGGTINHVTTEFIHHIDKNLLEKNDEFHNEINHRLIKVFSNILIPSITDFKRKLEQVNKY
jgi:hypothetical protein